MRGLRCRRLDQRRSLLIRVFVGFWFEVTICITVRGRPPIPLDVQVPEEPFQWVANYLPSRLADCVEHKERDEWVVHHEGQEVFHFGIRS